MKIKGFFLFLISCISISFTENRYEAENAVEDENSIVKVTDSKASGGFYINMKEGNLSFTVTVSTSGFYSLWICYSQPNDSNGKIQNLAINGSSAGQISFPRVDSLLYVKASPKIKLTAGSNTIRITKSWGWVNLDYIEILPYSEIPFTVSSSLVTSDASVNARKMYSFLKDNFQKKIISGVMTNTVMQNDGKYTPNTVENQTEVAWIISKSQKTPALLGLDFLHATGSNSDDEWFKGYTKATVALAKDIFKKGGIPAYCWHWRDPSKNSEGFYTKSSNSTPVTDFNLKKAFTDSCCTKFNENSDEYKAMLRDMDTVAACLKELADEGVALLWRPLHEASGKWFWWGGSGPDACKSLYRLMFERFTQYHKLNNLLWVWTTDEAGDALDWYPGDAYVDIVGRDYYYYPRERNHGSLVASFEKVKEIFGGRKIVTLSENGSIPYPDSLVSDMAGWSYFMPWYGDYTMDGWAHDNTADDWDKIMNHSYVITLDKMPGWNNYAVSVKNEKSLMKQNSLTVICRNRNITVTLTSKWAETVDLYSLNGAKIRTLLNALNLSGTYSLDVKDVKPGVYSLLIKGTNRFAAHKIYIR